MNLLNHPFSHETQLTRLHRKRHEQGEVKSLQNKDEK
jgi:hypothetical protein